MIARKMFALMLSGFSLGLAFIALASDILHGLRPAPIPVILVFLVGGLAFFIAAHCDSVLADTKKDDILKQ